MTETQVRLEADPALAPCPVLPALIWAEGIDPPRPTETTPEELDELLRRVRAAGEEFVPAEMRQRVRKMLRFGVYKPSGRGKPASEFLLRAALSDSFPLVNGPVDVNNIVSLESGLPGSIFDSAISGRHLVIRRGSPDESYVFNPSGQSIGLQDLLLVCRQTDYAPADEPADSVERWASRYTELLGSLCGAERVGCCVGFA